MKKTLLLITFLTVCFFGFGQSERHYVIRYQTQNDTVVLNTQAVNGIHIDAYGQDLTHEDGTVWSALTDLDTVYIYREAEPQGDWVDLGLPSGLLWATRNVGASSPEDYGDYFAWAETQPKSYYDWDNYTYSCHDYYYYLTKYCNRYYYLTKYCNRSDDGCNGYTDNLTILQPGDDAATANWGNGCRTPTREEWEELIDHCTSVWTTQNGVNGRRFTGPNGNTLFLPAAGYRWDDFFNFAGGIGYYWSSSLYTVSPGDAWYCYFGSGGSITMGNAYRYDGFSVRAVRSARQK